MTMASPTGLTGKAAPAASWLPMAAIAMAQFLLSFNFAALPMTIGPMVKAFGTPPTTVSTAIVIHSLCVAALIMFGAKLGQLFGSKLVFQIATVVFGLTMAAMTFSSSATHVIVAQALAGMASAAIVPSLVVLIAANYDGERQAGALGLLGSAKAFAGLAGFLLAGVFGSLLDWRYTFALMIPFAAATALLGSRMDAVERQPDMTIDFLGAALAAAAIVLLSLGVNGFVDWGVVLASRDAPFSVLGLSPAPLMVAAGVLFGQVFMAWEHRRRAIGKTPLFAVEVVRSRRERAAVYSMFVIVALGACVNFLTPLYIMIVQGLSSLQTGVAMMPYNLTMFFAAMLVVRYYERFAPRAIARASFLIVGVGLTWLAFVIWNDWDAWPVKAGLVAMGAGQGALITLLFNVLVTASPKELAGDVGSLRGATSNLASAVGTAVAAALAVGILSAIVLQSLVANPVIPPELKAQVDLYNINFISNDRLLELLRTTTASPEQVAEAVRINTMARLQTLKIIFLLLSGAAFLAILPAASLPGRVSGGRP